jgi:hypothetical protein
MGLARGKNQMHARILQGEALLRSSFVTVAIAMVAAMAQPGCGLWQENVSAEHHDTAEQVEPMLEQAGFERLPADTAAKRSELASLEPLKLIRTHDPKRGTLYWYADPYVCGCMYAGNEAARQRYHEIRQTQQTTNQMKAEKVLNTQAWDQVGEAPEINMFNPVFSP